MLEEEEKVLSIELIKGVTSNHMAFTYILEKKLKVLQLNDKHLLNSTVFFNDNYLMKSTDFVHNVYSNPWGYKDKDEKYKYYIDPLDGTTIECKLYTADKSTVVTSFFLQ